MKIVVIGWGTTGDVFPVLALSERLLRRGHQVRVCAPALYKNKILEIGAEFYEIDVVFDLSEFHIAMDAIIPKRDPVAVLQFIVEEGIMPRGERWYRGCLNAMEGFDIAICHSLDIPGQEAAIRNGLPWLTVTYCPDFIKTLDSAPYPFPNWGRIFNAIVWKLAQLRLTSSVDALFNQFIVSVGGKPRTSVALDEMYSPHLNLIAASPTLCSLSTFSPNHKLTGIWHLASPSYVPPPELVSFLAKGPPPVIISFGSMGGSNGAETTAILIDAVRKANQRAIIQAGWGKLGTEDTLPDIFCTEYVPHQWLFPKGCCVVHHGGAGTTASACRAKVPSVVVAHFTDQPYWGKRLSDLGVAPRHLHRRSLTAERLARRIRQVLATPAMRDRAQVLGKQLEAEDGLATAVELIESFN
ncbi:glycosyltransferase family 1 protein [Candidatus Poribacteria bacterium]|nr:glycosyltransferase family 1 protein [Candidatus Poribacteria bacterium]